jgi:D-3-phosphoglycerate dehydrogenase
MKELFLVTDTVPGGFIEEFESMGFAVEHIPVISNEDLRKTIAKYDGIVVNTSLIMNEEMLSAATRLKYILRPGSGLDNIDLKATEKRNILVLNSPEGNADAVGEHAAGLLLSLLNFIPRAVAEVRGGKWIRKPNTGTEIKGKTIGIIGYGHTGSAFAQKMSGFGARLLAYDKYKQGFGNDYVIESSLEDIFNQADILSFHIPLTAETRHILNDEFINRFSKPFYLINTSRGPVVEIEALIRGLQSGKVLGAALDVLENEKIDRYTPAERHLFETLLNAGNVIVTPHIAGWTAEARSKIFFLVLRKFREFLSSQKA